MVRPLQATDAGSWQVTVLGIAELRPVVELAPAAVGAVGITQAGAA